MTEEPRAVRIRPWAWEDLPLLERLLGDPEMTAHLGGPESREMIVDRHQRYCSLSARQAGRMFAIVRNGISVGSVGYWSRRWRDQEVWEAGWSVLPEHQGRGIATRATLLLLECARSAERYRFVHAFPSVGNRASNALCRKVGFEFRGPVRLEYPKDRMMECADWQFDLFRPEPG